MVAAAVLKGSARMLLSLGPSGTEFSSCSACAPRGRVFASCCGTRLNALKITGRLEIRKLGEKFWFHFRAQKKTFVSFPISE